MAVASGTLCASLRRGDAFFVALLAAVLGLALFLRSWNLDGPSLSEDEFLTLDRASMDLGRMFQVQKFQGPADTIFDLQPPLIYAALHGVLALSDTSLAARGLSAAAGCLTVFGFFLLGSRIAGRRAELLAARDAAWLAGSVPGLSPAGSMEGFLAENPGIVPVYTLRDGQGRDAVTVYDPLLGTAGMRLSRETPERTVRLPQGESLKVGGLVLGGKLRGPVIEVGGHRVEVPVVAPEGSVLTINAGGEGRLTFSPDFAAGFEALDTFDEENLARANHPDYQGGVTCKPGTRCHFTYLFVSAYPLEALRIREYPRLYGQPGDPGRAAVSYSVDGGDFLPLDQQTASRHEDWTPMHTQRTVSVRFDKPVRKLLLRFDLQANENAEFWSHTRPTDAMWIEADLGKVWLGPVQADGPEVPVKLVDPGENDVSVRLSGQPLVVRDAPRTKFFAQ